LLIQLDAQLPAVLRGEVKISPVEQVVFARVCRLRQQPVAAARLATEAFTKDPSMANNLDRNDRFAAALAAAAGCGQGKDGAALAAADRQRWRRQACEWLRADLALWQQRVAGGTSQDRSAAARKLRDWRGDPALAGVRDRAALQRLPEPERRAWRRLWADVAALWLRCAAEK
jgi:hypothetical protein